MYCVFIYCIFICICQFNGPGINFPVRFHHTASVVTLNLPLATLPMFQCNNDLNDVADVSSVG